MGFELSFDPNDSGGDGALGRDGATGSWSPYFQARFQACFQAYFQAKTGCSKWSTRVARPRRASSRNW